MKIVLMNYPADTSSQQKFLNKKVIECTNENHMIFLEHRMKQLKVIESKRTNREFFVMIFAKDDKEMIDNKNLILSGSRALDVFDIDMKKKIKINSFYRMHFLICLGVSVCTKICTYLTAWDIWHIKYIGM